MVEGEGDVTERVLGVLSICGSAGCCCCCCRDIGVGVSGGESDSNADDDVVVVSVDEEVGDSAALGVRAGGASRTA